MEQQFRRPGRLGIGPGAQLVEHLLARNARVRLQERRDFANDLRRRRQIHRRRRNRRDIRFLGIHLEQVQAHVPKRRPQRQQQRQGKPALLLPRRRHRGAQRAVVELARLRPRHDTARGLPQHRLHPAAHPLLRLGPGLRRRLVAFRDVLQAVHGFLAHRFLPLLPQRLVAEGFNVREIVRLGQMGKARRPQLLDLLVVAMVIRGTQ
jgi:hypothetical protein